MWFGKLVSVFNAVRSSLNCYIFPWWWIYFTQLTGDPKLLGDPVFQTYLGVWYQCSYPAFTRTSLVDCPGNWFSSSVKFKSKIIPHHFTRQKTLAGTWMHTQRDIADMLNVICVLRGMHNHKLCFLEIRTAKTIFSRMCNVKGLLLKLY